MNVQLLARTGVSARLLTAFASFGFAHVASAFTTSGRVLATDGSQSDVSAAIAAAPDGATVTIPAGNFTWGASGAFVSVNKPITLKGAGTGSTTITISTGGSLFANATIRVSAAATLRDFKIMQSGAKATTAISAGTINGWRITNILYQSVNPPDPINDSTGYFVYASSYGLIDNCTINGINGSDEWIFVNGPSNSWTTASSMGTANAVYIEDCILNTTGYPDFNNNARGVVRFCTVTGQIKIDGHGFASNSSRGVRHLEVYGNHWSAAAGPWAAMEMRGGTGMVFDNLCDNVSGVSVKNPLLILNEYGVLNKWPNFSNIFQTPFDYPIKDQIGVGQDPKTAASEPMYLWNNVRAGADWGIFSDAIPTGAITQYQTETSNPSATFTMADVVAADRDYFKQTFGSSFNGSSGVGRGTLASRPASPTKAGVGYWVTDEASWNNTLPANTSGQLYVWNGSAWVLKYTPYTYPHPLRAPRAPLNPVLGP